jgi:peptidoglycan/LPS O-acetylase OafA/YrhL
VVLALYLGLSLAVSSHSRLPQAGRPLYVLANVLLLPGVFPITPIVTVSWSLSYEIVFYLVLALAVSVLALRKWTAGARVALLGACLTAWLLSGLRVRAAVGSFVMFVPGLLLYEARRKWPRVFRLPAAGSLALALAVAAAIVVTPLLTLRLENGGFGGSPTTAAVVQAVAFVVLSAGTSLLIFGAVGTEGWLARALAWGPVRTVGLVSYSFYLIHGATINVFALLVTRLIGRDSLGLGWYLALLVPAYASCVGTSLLLFRAVERRFSF